MFRVFASAFVLCGLPATAMASPKIVVHPVQSANESIRYNHGVATIDQFSATGSVQVRPAAMEHGSLVFNVAVFNDAETPNNIDVSNFALSADDVKVAAMSVDTLEKRAKNRAKWSQVAMALAGGLSASAAAAQRDTYTSTLRTPRGVYHSSYSAPSTYGRIQAMAITAGTGVSIAAIQNRLDKTLEDLGDEVVQLSTVDPQNSYAGKIVFEKLKLKKIPSQVTMEVDWNGTVYPFTFLVAKRGTPAPAFKPARLTAPENTATPSSTAEQEAPSNGDQHPAAQPPESAPETLSAQESVTAPAADTAPADTQADTPIR